MKSLIIIGSVGMAIACASATDLRVSFDPSQSVAAIRTSRQNKDKNRFDVYGAFELIQLDAKARFKAVDCLHVTYSKDTQADLVRSGKEEGKYAENDPLTFFRFAEPLKDVQRIDIFYKENGTSVYVTTKNQFLRIIFDKNKLPKIEKIDEKSALLAKPLLLLLVPQGDQAPTFKNAKEAQQAAPEQPLPAAQFR